MRNKVILPCLAAAVALAIAAVSVHPARADHTVVVRTLPASADVGNYRLTLTRLRWNRPNINKFFPSPEKLLSMHYTLSAISSGIGLHGVDMKSSLKVRAYCPSRMADHFTMVKAGDGYTLITNVAPFGAPVRLDFLLTDPNATPQEIGQADTQASFDKVTVPPASSGPQRVDARYFTALGATVTLSTITIGPGGRGVTLDFTVQPSDSTPNVTDSYGGSIHVLGESGAEVAPDTWKFMQPDPAHWRLTSDSATLSDTGLTVKIAIHESLPAKQRSAATIHFSFDIPQSLPDRDPPPKDVASLASTSDGNVSAYIDRYYAKFFDPAFAGLRVFLRETPARDGVEWQVGSASAAIAGAPIAGATVADCAAVNGQFWHDNWTPVAAGETGANVTMSLPPQAAKSQPLQLTLKASPWTRTESDLRFSRIPLPAPGASKALSAGPDDDTGSVPVTLTSITRLNAANAAAVLGSVPAGDIDDWIALGFTTQPAAPGASVDLACLDASDDTGVWLEPDGLVINTATRVALKKSDGRSSFTVLLLPASPKASTIDVTVHCRVLTPAGDPRTLTFPSLVVRPTL